MTIFCIVPSERSKGLKRVEMRDKRLTSCQPELCKEAFPLHLFSRCPFHPDEKHRTRADEAARKRGDRSLVFGLSGFGVGRVPSAEIAQVDPDVVREIQAEQKEGVSSPWT